MGNCALVFGFRIAEAGAVRDIQRCVEERKTLSRWQWLWPLTIAALVLVASHRPRLVSTGVAHGDKIVHFAVYGLLATLVCRMGRGWRGAAWGLLAASAFGVTDEWHQSFIPGRSLEFADWVADTTGAAVAVTLYAGWAWYRALLEWPVWGGKRRIENAVAIETVTRA